MLLIHTSTYWTHMSRAALRIATPNCHLDNAKVEQDSRHGCENNWVLWSWNVVDYRVLAWPKPKPKYKDNAATM
ncbi:hypothetical protein M514_23589 [Trichuris suis]|uniref:Uncharacterized protein n=1 Tax=Trichuris suis TaxID=68888 RepID=A0A085N3Z7_9BILA|nr:hypothetical protein M514_23589 [Trichuris suis]